MRLVIAVCLVIFALAGVQAGESDDIKRLLKAAGQGDAEAQYDLGRRYAKGDGVPNDDTKAAVWYRKAAVQGHTNAQFYLGLRYVGGHGVTKDVTKAVEWYRKAAAQGHAKAREALRAVGKGE